MIVRLVKFLLKQFRSLLCGWSKLKVLWKCELVKKPVSCCCCCLRQVNGVSDGDSIFVPCVSVSVSVRSRPVSKSSKTVKATDFKFDMHLSRHDPLKIFEKGRDPQIFRH